jgi:hypothetical protein
VKLSTEAAMAGVEAPWKLMGAHRRGEEGKGEERQRGGLVGGARGRRHGGLWGEGHG